MDIAGPIQKKFSVVMSVYSRDDHDLFLMAVDSVVSQTVVPDELIIVADGPISSAMEQALVDLDHRHKIRLLRLEKNSGLGVARHFAILQARNELIGVMDADDIAVQNRFEQQLSEFESKNCDVVGGYIEEFEKKPCDLGRRRLVPLNHDEIVKFARWRQPVNHVTIMFKRTAYDRAGGYKSVRGIEDYDLIYRMIITGARFENIPSVLVHVRFETGVFSRRRGTAYLREENALLWRMRKSGFLSFWQWSRNSLVRTVARLLPVFLLSRLYLLNRK